MNKSKVVDRLTIERDRWAKKADLARCASDALRARGGSRDAFYLLELEARTCHDRATRLSEQIAAAPATVKATATFSIHRLFRRH